MKFEIEIKSLLGSQEQTDAFLDKLARDVPDFKKIDEQRQLNHYFKGSALAPLLHNVSKFFDKEQNETLKDISDRATSLSVRSRQKNGKTFLVVKGSLDAASADHSHRRMEFEEQVPITIEALDELLLNSELDLEAKWSAERTMYQCNDMTIDVMFSPGYGYVVEFEKVITDRDLIDETRDSIVSMMEKYGVKELNPERLARMFTYYNAHWQAYYGTRNIFVIE